MRGLFIVLGLAAVTVGDIVFPAVGDWGDDDSKGQVRQRYVADIMDQWCAERDCDFIMSTGDNFYPDGAESLDDIKFQDNWKNIYTGDAIKNLTWYMSIGNHDHNNDNEIYQLQYAKTDDQWYFPYYYYSFEVKDEDTSAFFYAIDTDSLRLKKHDPPAQIVDLEEKLATATTEWKIVFGHHPPLSVGKRWGDQTILDHVVPLCEAYDVDALISGHDHDLEHIVRTDDPDVEYVVSGAGGRYSHPYVPEHEEIINELGYEPLFFKETYGFTGVTLSENLMKVEYYDYTLEGDRATIRKVYEFTRQNVKQ